MRFVFINIQSIRNKVNQLTLFLESVNCDILCVNEHWLVDNELHYYVPNGYEVASSFCRSTNIHGGVAIYVKNNLNISYLSLEVKRFCSEKDFEIAAIIIHKIKILVITIYRTPDSDLDIFINTMEDFMKFISRYKTFRVFIFGDINIDPRNTNIKILSFLYMLRSFNFYCMNDKPTRNNSCLDNIITNSNIKYFDFDIIQPHLSDHCGFLMKLPIKEFYIHQQAIETKYFRFLNDVNIFNLGAILCYIDWNLIFCKHSSVDEAFSEFLDIVNNVFNYCCPILNRKCNRKTKTTKWFTPYLHKLRILLTVFYDKCKTNEEYTQTYLKLKRIYRSEIKVAKCKANENFILNSVNKTQAAWKVIKSEMCQNNNLKKQEIPFDVDEFNKYFVNVSKIIRPDDSNVNINKVKQFLIPKQIDLDEKKITL